MDLIIEPAARSFATAVVGTIGGTAVFAVSHVTALSMTPLTVASSNADFAVTEDACTGSSLAAGASCTFRR